MRSALVNEETGGVENVIEYDLEGDWAVPAGHVIVPSETAATGMVYKDGVFVWPDKQKD